MIRFFELPDLHFDPRWAHVTESAITAVEVEAEKAPPDFIALPGDLHNRPLYAADRSGYSRLLGIVRRLLAIAPVVAIEGTPSHDAPGAYAPLEELGLVLLRPGRVYRLFPGEVVDSMKNGPEAEPLAILFGVPELDKDWAETLDADSRAGDVLTAWNSYIDEFIAPHRANADTLPAVALLHGVVSDSSRENETDVIKKVSSLLLHTEDMRRADVDRWILGDLHTPWESKKISAGYAGFTGIDDNPWGKTNFVPSFNVTEISNKQNIETEDMDLFNAFHVGEIRRVAYGTPKRVKLTAPVAAYHPSVAYWLESDVDDPSLDPGKLGGHPWSRITFTPKKAETRRVTEQEAENASGMGDLIALMNPDESTPVRKAIADTIDLATGGDVRKGRAIELESIKISGAVFFKEALVELNVSDLPSGLTSINGDNGAGKSSLLAFCSPYPVVIGKDTESGRVSAVKEFFSGRESFVEKKIWVNGEEHRHLITIKGAHTKSAKTECYLYIDGVNVLETTNFDAMLSKTEELYGPLDDYLRTYQYVQPQQGGSPSGLMSAGAVELRNIVQNIAGIDRSGERRAALDKTGELEAHSAAMTNKLGGMVSFSDDPEALEAEIIEADQSLYKAEAGFSESVDTMNEAKAHKAEAVQRLKAAEESEERAKEWQAEYNQCRNRNDVEGLRKAKLEDFDVSTVADDIKRDDGNTVVWKRYDEACSETKGRNDAKTLEYSERNSEYQKRKAESAERLAEFQRLENEFDSHVSKIEAEARNARNEIVQSDIMIEEIRQPCEACGHVAEAAQERIRGFEKKKDYYAEEVNKLEGSLDALVRPVPPEHAELPEPPELPTLDLMPDHPISKPLSAELRATLEAQIKRADEIAILLPEVIRGLEAEKVRLQRIENRRVVAEDCGTARLDADTATESLEAAEAAWRRLSEELASISARIDGLKERLSKAKEQVEKIREIKTEIVITDSIATDWRWVAAQLAPAKLPAFELDMVLDSIDERASRNIEPFHEGRYRINTETQREGASGKVDKFSIVVYDAESGAFKSFLKHSPGEKAFIALAYQRALIAEREERTGVRYTPHVLDEADGPVQPERVPEYYAMQAETVGAGRALVVSHAPDAKHYIGNSIDIEELKNERNPTI